MFKNKKTILITALAVLTLTGGGCSKQPSNINTGSYSSEGNVRIIDGKWKNFSFKYPSNYSLEDKTAGNSVQLVIKGPKGRVEISNFDWAAVPVPDKSWSQERVDAEVPKDIVNYDDSGAALFYSAGDEVTKKELEAIKSSIVKK